MKKLLKLLGLLLIAGALVVSCTPSGDDGKTTDTIELSDGTWEMEGTGTASATEQGVTTSVSMTEKLIFEVAGDDITFTSGTATMKMTMEYPPEYASYLAMMKETYEQQGYDVTVSGSKLTATQTEVMDDAEIAKMNAENSKVSTLTDDLPEDAEITVNSNKTKYTVNYTVESMGQEMKYKVTFTKK